MLQSTTMGIIFSIIGFLLILSFLVIIHELGHYLTAKWFKVSAPEFGVGFPPKALTLFRRFGTEFTLNWVPIGGFVRMEGEDRDDAATDRKIDPKSNLFYQKPRYQRIIILLAGATVNFVFGIVAFSTMFTVLGVPETLPVDNGVVISGVTNDSPAQAAGLLPGDIVTDINPGGPLLELIPITSVDEFVASVGQYRGQNIDLLVEREGQELVINTYVRTQEETPADDGAVGVMISDSIVDFVKYPWWQRPFRGAVVGIESSFAFGLQILEALRDMVTGLASSGQVPDEIGGPVRIAYEFNKAGVLSEGFLGILNYAALLSINLAVVNVLPIPALDGGRAIFVLLESILGKRFKPVFERYANTVGFFLLIGLILLISFRDIAVVIGEVTGR